MAHQRQIPSRESESKPQERKMTDAATLPPAEALKPAREMAEASRVRWPGESADYRRARTDLLAGEIALRRQIQRLAEQRRALPPGPLAADYRFRDEQGEEIGLVDLFGRHDSLFTYVWMYGPERERPCPMCTSFVGSLDIPAPDIEQRLALAIIGRSPVARQRAFARERGWRNLKFYQTIGDDFARDYRVLQGDAEWAAILIWKRDGDGARLFWAAEGGPETADPGFDPHLAPDPTPLWNILDWTPEGRPVGWYPKLDYGG
jgi:predicted dithiol-disulfide oxidoreductase (DUF899 family)